MLRSLYRHDGWGIGLIFAPVERLLAGPAPEITWLPLATPQAFAADPFLVEDAGRLFCFFEMLPYAENRGKICYARLDPVSGRTEAPVDAIATPFHLSYPFLLRHDGEWLCIPEAGESGAIGVWAARDFPDGWYRKATLLDGVAGVDPTLHFQDGRWWLFATDASAGWNDALHLWYADELFGRWTPHPQNPIVTGLAGARPAGRLFAVEGSLYRPAQDCTLRYGHRVIVQQIETLSVKDYRERTVAIIAPERGPFPHGLHTLNGCGALTVVDGNRQHFVRQQAMRAIMRKLARNRRRSPAY